MPSFRHCCLLSPEEELGRKSMAPVMGRPCLDGVLCRKDGCSRLPLLANRFPILPNGGSMYFFLKKCAVLA